MNFFAEKRREVMLHIEQYMLDMMSTYLKPIDTNWQPTDFLPVSTSETFFQDIKSLFKPKIWGTIKRIVNCKKNTVIEKRLEFERSKKQILPFSYSR